MEYSSLWFFWELLLFWLWSLPRRTTVSEYEQKNSQLQKESAQLQESLDTSQKELTRWRDRSQEITANLNKVSEEFLLLQNQYNLLLKEKAALRDKNQALNRQMEDLNKLYLQTKKQAEDTSAQELLKQKEALEKEVEALKSGMMPSFAEEEQDEESLNAQLWKEKTTRAALEDKLFQSERKLRALTEEKNKLSAQLTKMKKALEQRLSQFSQSEQVLQSALAAGYTINADDLDTYTSGQFLRSDAGDVYNEDGADIDLRFEGDTESNLAYLDASADKIGIGTAAPAARLTIKTQGTDDILNLIETGGTEVLTVLESGNMGIGTAAPTVVLDVVGNINATGTITAAGIISGGNITMGDDEWIGLGASAGRIAFDNQTIDEIEIMSGNVGIGTAGTAYKLDVLGAAGIGIGTSSSGDALVITGTGNVGIGTAVSAAYKLYVNGDTYLGGVTVTGGTLSFGGNLGIGTAAPTYELDVVGNIGLNQYLYHNDDADTYLNLTDDALAISVGSEAMVTITEDGTQDIVEIGDDGDIDIKLSAGADGAVFVQGSSGNVGIGTLDPGIYKLYVNGDTYLGGLTVIDGQLTYSDNLDMQNYIITNIGHSGTDFVAASGGLNLAGDLNIGSGKFTAASATGNTAVAGTLAVTGDSTLTSDIAVNGGDITTNFLHQFLNSTKLIDLIEFKTPTPKSPKKKQKKPILRREKKLDITPHPFSDVKTAVFRRETNMI